MHHDQPESENAELSPRQRRAQTEQRREINELKARVSELQTLLDEVRAELVVARNHTVTWMRHHAEVATDMAMVMRMIPKEATMSEHPASAALLQVKHLLAGSTNTLALDEITDAVMDSLIRNWSTQHAVSKTTARAQVHQWLVSQKKLTSQVIGDTRVHDPRNHVR
jgi:hypothetical protein